jgi:SpoVK/Ycf46/Vps4 family AAA+-type ATPase
MPDMDGSFRWDTAPKRITFNMAPFNTFKSINNIFGSHIAKIRERVNLFINHQEWYEKRGIPHTLGILLHGRPGCGKTSLIKAIARDTNRHVFNISLRKTTTQRQLINLFFDENIATTNAANETSIISIPLDQRIYVIEDIDCMSDVVIDRGVKTNSSIEEMGDKADELMIGMPGSMNTPIDFLNGMSSMPSMTAFSNISKGHDIKWGEEERARNPYRNTNKDKRLNKNIDVKENKDEITLSFLLNLLDGVLETPNRILIITSNYPERLDKALIRPGRIDLNIHFDNADMEMIFEMFRHFYNLTILEAKKLGLDPKIDKIFTPAEVIAVLCNNYKNVDDAVASLNNLAKQK